MRASTAAAVLLPFLALAAPARGQDVSAQDLVGTWRREPSADEKIVRLIRLEPGSSPDELVGKMLNPPENRKNVPYGVDLKFKLSGSSLEGTATWSEENPNKGKPGEPDRWTADASWKLTVESPGKMSGKTESFGFRKGVATDREFNDRTFTRLPAATLGGPGAAPAKVEAGAPIDDKQITGSWRTQSGAIVTIKAQDGGYTVDKVTAAGDFPASFKLKNDGGVLKGQASFEGGAQTEVELKLAAPGRLEGRCERIEGDPASPTDKGWAPLALDVLARIDAGEGEAPSLAPPAEGAALALDLKRDDGLYLHLVAKGAGFEGELVSKSDGVRATVALAAEGGVFKGKATWKSGGESAWELSPQADGTVSARCEWLDWDEKGKTAVARGFSARKFKPLRKAG